MKMPRAHATLAAALTLTLTLALGAACGLGIEGTAPLPEGTPIETPVPDGGSTTLEASVADAPVPSPDSAPEPEASAPLLDLVPTLLTAGQEVDLDAEGTLAWAHWGLDDVSSRNEKAVPLTIPSFQVDAPIGDLRQRFTSHQVRFRWSNGRPVASQPGTTTGVFAKRNAGATGEQPTFALDVAASTSERVLRVYAGVYQAAGLFRVTLLDEPVPTFEHAFESAQAKVDKRLTIRFRARRETTLRIGWAMTPKLQTADSNVTLTAATLSDR